jgi:hypothetical protein
MPSELKSYSAPWNGSLILACRKCQKKLKCDAELQGLAKLRKTVKSLNKRSAGKQLFVLNVPCMDVCPKGGVTICRPEEEPGRVAILRSEKDIDRLYPGSAG